MEAIWTIANSTYGVNICQILVDLGIIPICLNIILENQNLLLDHAIVAIGNIIADNIKFRDIATKAGVL